MSFAQKGIIRVFPTKTSASPNDDHAFFDQPPLWLPENATEVHISCTFSWDKQRAEQLAKQWETTGLPVKVGGVAYGDRGGEFEPGMYLRQGITITSRGCNNKCWFCSVWRRDGDLRELAIRDGWEIYDDNILQCQRTHIEAVFAMLAKQPHRPKFLGGIEAKMLERWHVELFVNSKTERLYFAYDTPDDYEPLVQASKLLHEAWHRPEHRCYCYVLCGYRGDDVFSADTRMRDVWELGFMPFAMLYRDESGKTDPDWHKFRRAWTRPAASRYLLKNDEMHDGNPACYEGNWMRRDRSMEHKGR